MYSGVCNKEIPALATTDCPYSYNKIIKDVDEFESKIKAILGECIKFPLEIMDDNLQLYKICDAVEGFTYFTLDEDKVKNNIQNIINKM